MLAKTEVLGLLLHDEQSSAQMLVRDAEGRMRLQDVSRDSVMARYAMSTGCFRRARPIVDPVTREVMGYEMEAVPA